MQIGPKLEEIGACACIVHITIYCFLEISKFLDVANASSIPHLKLRNLLKWILYYKVQLFHTDPLTLFHPGGADLAPPRANVYTRKKTMDGNSKKNCIFLNVY